ncbi:MAG: hypothetical protein JNN17_02490 [Verrucomicrobiaceae bacterium]|nr:hypothetical protein [Verrucomicrobiaceae bacterium]
MLESLDTLIAFVVIMSIASLLVTIVVQTISATFSLRGRQLLRGLQNAGDTLIPDGMKAGKELAKELLKKKPAMCFAFWDGLKDAVRPDEIYESLKALAAISEEALAKKQNEVDLAKTTAETARNEATNSPGEAEKGKKAISAEKTYASLLAELVVLKELPRRNPLDKSSPNQQAANLLAALMPAAKDPAATKDALGGLLKVVGDACLSGDDRKKLESEIQKASQSMVEEVVTLKKSVENWFNQAVDHAQDWFLTWTRAITIVVGVLMAFAFQWDAVEIFKQVSGPNNAMRDALVKKVPVVLEKGEGILKVSKVGGGLLERLQTAWNKSYEPSLPSVDGIKTVDQFEKRLEELAKGLEETEKKQAHTEVSKGKKPGENATDAEVENKRKEIHQKAVEAAKALKPAKELLAVSDLKAKFEVILTDEVKGYFDSQQEAFAALSREVSVAGFEIIPKDGWRWTEPDKQPECIWWKPQTWALSLYLAQNCNHIPGMLIFAALLGLGAPFWFNLLKNLSNLRPALAKLLDTETSTPAKTPK